MDRKLTDKERTKLIARHKKERDGRVRDRIKAVLAFDDGYTYTEIAKILLLDDETIRRHVVDYFRENKLSPDNGGSPSKLTPSESQKLISHLDEFAYLHVKDICRYVCITFKQKYSLSGMTKWLHENKFSYKKPHGVPAKANREIQNQFIDYYNNLKEEAGDKEPIYFVDSVHPQHQTKLSYGWILQGKRKAIATTGRQKRLNFMGGICLKGHRIVYKQTDKVNANSIASFLVELRRQNSGKHWLHVIWDNAGYHSDQTIQEFALGLSIKLHYLPPYSPNLNPIERLWKIMHEQVTYNKYYEKFADFADSTIQFFKTIGRKKKLLRSRITDNFQILHSPLFAS